MSRKKVATNIAYDDVKERYYVTFYHGSENKKGVKDTKSFETKREAEQALAEHIHNRSQGVTRKPTKYTVASWLTYWLDTYASQNLQPTTIATYTHIINDYIIPSIGNTHLQKLSFEIVEGYYRDIGNAHNLSSNTLRKHHDLLSVALQAAVKKKILVYNIMTTVDSPKKIKVEHSFYSAMELAKLADKARGTILEIVVLLAGYCGLRRGEILGLQYSNIDFEKREALIINTRTTAGSKIVEKKPKTEDSARRIYLVDAVYEILKRMKDEYIENRTYFGSDFTDSGYVVVYPNGKPYSPSNLSSLFGDFTNAKGFKSVGIHGLRHTFTSIAYDSGSQMYGISKALGHSSQAVTSNTYTHLMRPNNQDVMSNVANMVDEQRSKGD